MPTYNEALNLEPVVEATRAELPAGSRILVVDDNSPDGTGQVADRLAQESDDLEVLHRPEKEGLGPAYIAGFHHVLDGRGRASSSRWTRTSRTIPPTSRACSRPPTDADVVIGSRYVEGGGVPDWGLAAPRDEPGGLGLRAGRAWACPTAI